ncbi:MAG: hypothetical protein CMN30_17175 [Sandaracinus sp.]|nr:hypothetical protein [Sandaracinus sp.]
MRSLGAIALGLLAATTVVAQPTDPPQDPRDAARRVTERNGYPTRVTTTDQRGGVRSFPSLPGGGADGEEGDRQPLQRSGRTDLDDHRASDMRNPADIEPEGSGWSLPSLAGLGGLGQMIVYGVLAVGVLALLALLGYVVFNFWPSRSPDSPRAVGAAPPVRRTADGLPFEVGDPDALAAEGRYAEAILALLVQSLRAVGWRPAVQDSMTAREVLASLTPSDPRQPPLRAVVDGAERVRFADEPATRELFEALRAQRDLLQAADQREAA